MKNYKIGDWVIWIDKEINNDWKKSRGISLYGKIAEIINITPDKSFLLEFKKGINGHAGHGWGRNRGKYGHCKWSNKTQVKTIDYLKFKKWVKGE